MIIIKNYTKNLLYRSDLFEIYVICWNPNKNTPIHNHPENGCLMKILNGVLVEYEYNKQLNLTKKNIILEDDVKYIDNVIGYHQIFNDSKENYINTYLFAP